jgi:iron(III) transport system ATP-binding protein
VTQPIAVQDLRLRRVGFELGPLSFSVAAGGRLAIVGPSGSGKTTLLRCLAGLERPDGGTIRIGERVVDQGGVHVAPDQRGVGLVFQDGALWSHMTALQHVLFAAPRLDKSAAMALLDRAGLGAHAAKKPAALSGGEAQRLGLVRALAPAPAVLLLDEPLRSVDVHQRDALVLLLRELAEENHVTTLLVTHDREEALALAADLVVLHGGKLVEQGQALELVQRPRTAFTASFLLGATCLPTTVHGDRLRTPFGEFPRPASGGGDVRLVLLPADVSVQSNGVGGGVAARVLGASPADAGFRLRLAVGDQLLHANSAAALPAGSRVFVTLAHEPRFLPWQRNGSDLSPDSTS